MTSVARTVAQGPCTIAPGAIDVGRGSRGSSSCPAVSPIVCRKGYLQRPRARWSKPLSGLRGAGIVSERHTAFLGSGGQWQHATADCRCGSARVQMSEPSLYKGLSARLIKTFGMAELEARKLKYATTGTEALLMGMLTEGTSKAARFLRTKGVTLYAVKQETVKLLGKGDMYYNPPEHPPVTEPGRKALEAAHSYWKTLSGGEGEVTTEHMLLGLLDQTAATAAQVLKTLGVDDAAYEELKQLAAGQATTVA